MRSPIVSLEVAFELWMTKFHSRQKKKKGVGRDEGLVGFYFICVP